MRHRLGRLPLLTLLAVAGCLDDAERGNPLDPRSDNYRNAGAVVGFVTRLTPPSQGIRDATLHLTALDSSGVELVTHTDSEGRFSFSDAPIGRYLLTASAPGFADADTTVEVTLDLPPEVTLSLDGVPAVAHAVRTEYIERWVPVDDPLYRLVVDATVSDPDGLSDIERVALVISDLGFEDTLTVVTGGQPGEYSRVFEESELPVPLPDLAGLSLDVEAMDRAGVTGSAQGVQIVRVMTEAPSGSAPVLGDTLDTRTPVLSWEAANFSFTFTYRIEVVRVVAGLHVTVWERDDLPASQTQLQVPEDVLDLAGDYYWTVAAVDAFGNLGRSKENGFTVSP